MNGFFKLEHPWRILFPLEAKTVGDNDRSPWAPASVVMSLVFAGPPIFKGKSPGMGTRLLMEWPWCPPLTSSSNTFYACCIPIKRMQGRYRDGNGMLGKSLKKTVSQNTVPISTTRFTSAAAGTQNPYGLLSAADLLGWSYTWQTWDWLMELFLLRSTSRRAKKHKQAGRP